MTENANNQQESNSSAGTENTENMIPKERFNKVIAERNDLAKRLEALETAQTEREDTARKQRETELAEQNQYKQLYEAAKAENEQLKSVQGELKRYQDALESTYKARLEQIPEDRRHLIAEHGTLFEKMAHLDRVFPDLVAPSKPTAPRLDGGSGGSGSRDSNANINTTQQDLANLAQQSGFAINRDRLAGFVRNPTKQTDLSKKDES